jgi:hypothetical protein
MIEMIRSLFYCYGRDEKAEERKEFPLPPIIRILKLSKYILNG